MERELPARDVSEPVEIELADMAAIMQMSDTQAVVQPPMAARQRAAVRNKPRRCACGACRTCLDNAKWESVFQKKFADPYYYSLRDLKQGSSLNGF